jgi:lipopolysaccharide export system protein LptA
MNVFTLCFYLVLGVQLAPVVLPMDLVRLSARKVDVNHELRVANLSGDVRMGWGEFTLTAQRVEIQYSETGTPKKWRAVNDVKVKWRTHLIESSDLSIEQSEDRLNFKGPLVLVDGSQRLNAASAILFIKEKRFVIQEVSGQMNLKQLVSPR